MVVLSSFPPPTEGIRHLQPNTITHVENKDLGKGTLYIAESRVSWVSDEGRGFSLEYPAIALHAVSKDLSAYPLACLYLMVDANLDEAEKPPSDGESEEDDKHPMSEIRFIPDDSTALESMFQSMTECQALHPDPNDSLSDDDDNFEDAENDDDVDSSHIVSEAGDPGYAFSTEGLSEAGINPFAPVVHSEDEPMDIGQFEDAEPDH